MGNLCFMLIFELKNLSQKAWKHNNVRELDTINIIIS